jgi:hypothetical protein
VVRFLVWILIISRKFSMTQMTVAAVQKHFLDLTDPRRREPTYPLMDMVVMALCAVICGADDFVAIAKFARTKKEWLSQFLDLSNGVPSHDRFNAVFAALKPEEFEKCLLNWVTSLHEITDGQVVAIDGKTLRRSYDKASSKSAIHMVSAWATLNHISLGQVVTDEKSNEITAIPKLLKMLEIKGALVTIDAMGCQTEIAKTIVDADADYFRKLFSCYICHDYLSTRLLCPQPLYKPTRLLPRQTRVRGLS